MKTNEQIESAIISKFANDVLGVSAIKEEHVNNQLAVADSELAVAAAKKQQQQQRIRRQKTTTFCVLI